MLSIIKLNFYICVPDSLVYVSNKEAVDTECDSHSQTPEDLEKCQSMQEA